MSDCPFCDIQDYVLENDYCYAIYDRFPVSPGHMLVIPKRHAEDFLAASDQEQTAGIQLVQDCVDYLKQNNRPDGFNVGINCGRSAGQTIFHWHIHVIPRYRGDVCDPTGGVRGVIPSKMKYSVKD